LAIENVCNRHDAPLLEADTGHTIACHVELEALRSQSH